MSDTIPMRLGACHVALTYHRLYQGAQCLGIVRVKSTASAVDVTLPATAPTWLSKHVALSHGLSGACGEYQWSNSLNQIQE